MNLATNLERSAQFFPDRPAISEGTTEISYGQLNDRCNRVATGLIKMGIRPGDRIGLFAPNSADWITFYFGVLKAGAMAITLSSVLKRDELTLLVNHAKPRFILGADDRLEDLENLRGSAGLETIVCPKGDVTLQKLMDIGDGRSKRWTETVRMQPLSSTRAAPQGCPKGYAEPREY